MTSYVSPICGGCSHMIGLLFDPAHPNDRARCRAFPDATGIPWSIFLSQVDHRQAVPGDHDIRFATKTPKDPEYAAMLFEPVGDEAEPCTPWLGSMSSPR